MNPINSIIDSEVSVLSSYTVEQTMNIITYGLSVLYYLLRLGCELD